MIKFLAKIFIKDYKNTENAEVRRKYGILAGAVGIALNVLLFVLKLAAGIFTGSVAVMADAFNNISDAGSSGITMIGFRLAGKKPDPEHPFGHGRIEYITGFIVSILIFVMGFELATSSFEAIKNPKQTELSPLSLTILALSVIIKLYMYFYNHHYGKKLNSAAMKATASDSLSDTVSTLAVIASLLFAHFTDLLIDGGVNHARVAVAALGELGLQFPVFGMVKDDRHRTRALVTPGGQEIRIDAQQVVFALIGTIQEEVHRFAITYHRQKRSKRLRYSELDQIPGVGPKRKEALLKSFHSIAAIRQATLPALERLLPKDAAMSVYMHFHKESDV